MAIMAEESLVAVECHHRKASVISGQRKEIAREATRARLFPATLMQTSPSNNLAKNDNQHQEETESEVDHQKGNQSINLQEENLHLENPMLLYASFMCKANAIKALTATTGILDNASSSNKEDAS